MCIRDRVSNKFLVSLLDPYSSLVPEDVRKSWVSEDEVYKTSRNFCYAMHNKRSKLLESKISSDHKNELNL